jgi:hypothetical protein
MRNRVWFYRRDYRLAGWHQINAYKKMNKNKKGQIETMGLLVIVILVSLILFFALTFSLRNPQTGQPDKNEFKQNQAISTFGSTMLETTSNCNGWTIKELIEDCAFLKEINCNGESSCVTANNSMKDLLDLTLNKWGYDYNLTIYDANKNIVLSAASGCKEGVSSEQVRNPFATRSGSMAMTIKTCSK